MGSPSQSITMVTTRLLLASGLLSLALSDFVGHNHGGGGGQLARGGRQDETIQGGIDFSGCQQDAETGLCCVEKEETVTSLEKEPILECTHKNVDIFPKLCVCVYLSLFIYLFIYHVLLYQLILTAPMYQPRMRTLSSSGQSCIEIQSLHL